MTTHVTISPVSSNDRGVRVYVEEKRGAQWVPTSELEELPVGRAAQFLVYGTRRLVIEEVEHD